MPREDVWIVQRIAALLSQRLYSDYADTPAVRRALVRMLFGVQRLPRVTDGAALSLCAGSFMLVLSEEEFGLHSHTDEGHTQCRLQYFVGSHHCLYWFDALEGEERLRKVSDWLDDLEISMKDAEPLMVEDYSKGNRVDQPPLGAVWKVEESTVVLSEE